MKVLAWFLRLLLLFGLPLSITSCTADAGGPLDAKGIYFKTAYGDLSHVDQGKATYTNADGTETSVTVTIPWRSSSVEVKPGVVYTITVEAEANPKSPLGCGMGTDNGWNVGTSTVGEVCTFRFPLDVRL